jgi:hypothetical protein
MLVLSVASYDVFQTTVTSIPGRPAIYTTPALEGQAQWLAAAHFVGQDVVVLVNAPDEPAGFADDFPHAIEVAAVNYT